MEKELERGNIKVHSPFVLPQRKLSELDFIDFCQVGLGVSPCRVEKDLQAWLDEDSGAGDVTLFSAFNGNPQATMFIIAKQDFTLSCLQAMAQTFRLVSKGTLELFSDFADGDLVRKGNVVLGAKGTTASILMGERVALNFGCKMSGIASKTRSIGTALAEAAGVSKPVLLETRKTTPGLRIYEKYSTRVGGARNHRHGLDGGAMLKENHLRSIGNIVVALRNLKKRAPLLTKIEIEVTNLDEFACALEEGADVIMLDNFSSSDIHRAVELRNAIKPSVALELSGNLDAENVHLVAESGVDYVSMGALIHKAVWVDMSLQLFVNE